MASASAALSLSARWYTESTAAADGEAMMGLSEAAALCAAIATSATPALPAAPLPSPAAAACAAPLPESAAVAPSESTTIAAIVVVVLFFCVLAAWHTTADMYIERIMHHRHGEV
jgi:hypothetical protein